MTFEHLPTDDRAVNIALGVDAEAFGAGMIGRRRLHVFDERRDASVPRAADADAFLDAHQLMRAGIGTGFGIRDIDRVVFGDEDAAGPAELTPLIQQLALLVEDLDP